jgi:hypothetical protein
MKTRQVVRCEGCAFTAGTEANLQPLTLLKATLCVRILEPFFCHDNLVDGKLPKGEEKLCAGYVEAMDVLHGRGYYKRQPKNVLKHLRKHLRRVLRLEDYLLEGGSVGIPSATVAALARDLARDKPAPEPGRPGLLLVVGGQVEPDVH